MESKVKEVLLGEYLVGDIVRHTGRVMREMRECDMCNSLQGETPSGRTLLSPRVIGCGSLAEYHRNFAIHWLAWAMKN